MYKTTIVIWSKFDPTDYDIEDLAREALAESDAFCSSVDKDFIDVLEEDPDWDESKSFIICGDDEVEWE